MPGKSKHGRRFCRILMIAAYLLPLQALAQAALSSPQESATPATPAEDIISAPASPKQGDTKVKTAPPSRASLLYENHCSGCHESTIHIRNRRKAKTRGQVRDWVRSRVDWLKLNWSNRDIDDVADYLNRRYYKYSK